MKTKIKLTSKIEKIIFEAKKQKSRNDVMATANKFGKLFEEGLSVNEISYLTKKMGFEVSPPHLYNYKKLSEISPKAKALLRTKADFIKATDVLGMMHKHMDDKELLQAMEEFIQKEEAIKGKEMAKKSKVHNQEEIIREIAADAREKYYQRTGLKKSINKFIELANQWITPKRNSLA